MLVRISEGSSIRRQHATSMYRRNINTIFHAGGIHGFKASITTASGVHTYCVSLINYGIGNVSPRYSCARPITSADCRFGAQPRCPRGCS